MNTARTLALLTLLPLMGSAQAKTIVLNTDLFPPYQINTPEGLAGTSVRTLECVFESIQQPYTIKIVPWERAINEVEQNRADGFFSATQMTRANVYATLSAPLALEKWYWYSRASEPALQPLDIGWRTGAIRGSNQAAWLQEKGIRIDQLVGSNEQLLQMLERGRIDRFVADQRTLRIELTRHSIKLRPGFEQFYKYATLGVYFSKGLLEREPALLSAFNRQVFYCLAETPSLDETEKAAVSGLHQLSYGHWSANEALHSAVRQQNQSHSDLAEADILALDNQWLAGHSGELSPLAASVLTTPTSGWLKEQQRNSEGLITEIMLTDRSGLLVAASELTTDYWQGDEAKFSEAFFAGGNEPYMGNLHYDQSSKAYQVHMSNALRDPESREIIGVLIIGLNIERALLKTGMGGKI